MAATKKKEETTVNGVVLTKDGVSFTATNDVAVSAFLNLGYEIEE
jgi:hypothetical protein|nr:MAG TPA: DXP reductoisomerase C-terminal domain [Caudoviricetes sp.]